jgi:hypothetical protein
LRRPCSTERTDGRWTSCSTKRWDCNTVEDVVGKGTRSERRAQTARSCVKGCQGEREDVWGCWQSGSNGKRACLASVRN